MKKWIAAVALAAALGFAAGSAQAGPMKPADQKNLQSSLANMELSLNEMTSVPNDALGHIKKAADYARKAIDELREALGMGHHPHSHDEK